MENKRALILVSNDDGFRAKGIGALVDMLRPLADVVVCAPEGPRSGLSCAFSAEVPLRLTCRRAEEGLQVWSCNGTPVDCVKMALDNIIDRRPDMMAGGINHGDNASVNAHYSGTVGIALEGCMKNIPSVAFSLCDFSADAHFEPLRPLVQQLSRKVLAEGLPSGTCLNVNFPLTDHFAGVRVCRMARGHWVRETVKQRHPRGNDYWWMAGDYVCDEPEAEDTDRWALDHGYVSVTPTRTDVTDYEWLKTFDFFLS
jgi:5'-nucleotidase